MGERRSHEREDKTTERRDVIAYRSRVVLDGAQRRSMRGLRPSAFHR
jgi:hypothetical protein